MGAGYSPTSSSSTPTVSAPINQLQTPSHFTLSRNVKSLHAQTNRRYCRCYQRCCCLINYYTSHRNVQSKALDTPPSHSHTQTPIFHALQCNSSANLSDGITIEDRGIAGDCIAVSGSHSGPAVVPLRLQLPKRWLVTWRLLNRFFVGFD